MLWKNEVYFIVCNRKSQWQKKVLEENGEKMEDIFCSKKKTNKY